MMKRDPVLILVTISVMALAQMLLPGCYILYTHNDEITDGSMNTQIPIYALENDELPRFNDITTSVSWLPSCGTVSGEGTFYGALAAKSAPFIFDRSEGVSSGTYYFWYSVTAKTTYPMPYDERSDNSSVRVNLTNTIPAPDGSDPCGASYEISIQGASAVGGRVTVTWLVPPGDGIYFADSYQIIIRNYEWRQIGSVSIPPPSNNDPQITTVSFSGSPAMLEVALSSIKDGRFVRTRTLMGVSVEEPGFILVDDHLQLVQGSLERAAVDVLDNDYLVSVSGDTARAPWARLDNASLAITSDGGLNASVTGGQLVEIGAESASPGQYIVAIETTAPGKTPQTQYLYVDYVEQGANPPTLADDSFVGYANEPVALPVLENDSAFDGGPLTITGFTRPGGGATVTSSGKALSITGPAGDYSFSYTARDTQGNHASATVAVRLVHLPAPPPIPQ